MDARRKIIIGSTATVVLVGGAAAGAIAATAASATPAMHTIHLISRDTAVHQLNRHTIVAAGTDRRAGKIVGYNVLHEQFSQMSGLIHGAAALAGGVIYFRIPTTGNSAILTGKITGGTGTFKGATGTITGKTLNKAGTLTKVTIDYQS